MRIREVLVTMADTLYDVYEGKHEHLENVLLIILALNKTIQAFPYADQRDLRFKLHPSIEAEFGSQDPNFRNSFEAAMTANAERIF
jgi:hypothetical protein